MDAVGGRNHALVDGFLQLAPQTARPSCREGECCHPASRLFVQPSANTELRPETKQVDSMLRPRARRRRQSATPRMTAARTKPAPFRNDAFRHGRGPLGPGGLGMQRDVRRSGCICAALQTNGWLLSVANQRLCEQTRNVQSDAFCFGEGRIQLRRPRYFQCRGCLLCQDFLQHPGCLGVTSQCTLCPHSVRCLKCRDWLQGLKRLAWQQSPDGPTTCSSVQGMCNFSIALVVGNQRSISM